MNWSGPAALRPPEAREEEPTVDEFWLEPRLPEHVMPRPAFGDVIGVDLHVELTDYKPAPLYPLEAPAPEERVPMTDAIMPSKMAVEYHELCNVTFSNPTGESQPIERAELKSCLLPREAEPDARVYPLIHVESPQTIREREAQKQIVLTQWSTPLLKNQQQPASQSAESRRPLRTAAITTFRVITWPWRAVSNLLNGPEEYYHIFPRVTGANRSY
jgi:hypothetical protein